MSRKPDIEFIREDFERNGWVLSSTDYKNNYTKLECVCPNGHSCSISWSNWQQGRRCPICAKRLCAEKLKKDFNIIKESFENNGCTLLTIESEYKNAHQKLDYICPNGHYHSITWGHWNEGTRCPTCAIKIRAGKTKKNFDIIKKSFKGANYILVTIKAEYKNSRQKLEYICPNGHYHSISWDNWQLGRRCPFCSNRVSRWEKEVRKVLSVVDIDYVVNDKKQLINPSTKCPLELDIWIPQLSKAIECNGLYWHSSDDRMQCDRIKQQLCQQQGIDLLVITDEEWNKDIDICKNKIKTFVCGVN